MLTDKYCAFGSIKACVRSSLFIAEPSKPCGFGPIFYYQIPKHNYADESYRKRCKRFRHSARCQCSQVSSKGKKQSDSNSDNTEHACKAKGRDRRDFYK